jgi:serine/threonine-protein kinase RsbW
MSERSLDSDFSSDLSLVIPNSRSGAQFARKRLAEYLRTCAVEPLRLREDVLLATGEALANAAEHGYRVRGTISLRVRITAERIEVHVTDDGQGFTPRPRHAGTNPYAPRGFGIHIMRTLMDSVEFHDNGRHVRLIKERSTR